MSLLTHLSILAALTSLTQARPSSVYIGDLNNATSAVCPIIEHIDTNINRIPRHIKHIKCATSPNPMCKQLQLTDKECCQHRSSELDYEMMCQETWDWVVVLDRKTRKKHPERVPVGCVCTIRKGWMGTRAIELPSGAR